ncbi:CBS domain-containing protein [Bacillus cytotoxicus]|uniref:Signal-transduction protein with CBS domains n=1 Tax=Bacillus cytotoxicus (strain DSM 22905 / CIP 110041 / 391-98 / NVH 391-98) TaxID=315749 RepID=A7GLE7_BACCN|nr:MULTISPECIES: CBS domain-containing protein [Bacillus cereus group]ABS20955.1 putative signal-transduction protein with CBS domains [Bacillus cytotoxicus NVH 391-98]AWC27594.1 CBS domain-containing protein [Bacillus cytotoxicus]AWC31599.1 CBS domain-containing protein [Bacillus cytotoxicus]AWC35639.1 CBS domain-containing protein [Bacillus cytotoxicus]AWC41031.1 CBS domain-containing protein [Bacillus cytotoxicus]
MLFVRDLMSTNIVQCTPLDNVYEAAVKMKEEEIGMIPVVDNNQIVGLVTDRDLVVRGIAEKHPGSNKITNVMTTNIVSVAPNDPVEKATELMARHQVRRLPVVENGVLVGMLALGDLATVEAADDQAGFALGEISEHTKGLHEL